MKPKILLVDDNVALLATLKTILESHGLCVTTAASANEATTKLSADFDFVLTDMRMETEHAGYEVVHAASLKRNQPIVLIMTAFPLLARDWRNIGVDRVFTKPTPMADLLAAIDKLLDVRAAAKEPISTTGQKG